jgi:hypothetical protein
MGPTFLWMTPFVFLDRERSEVHHGLDNLNTELPLPDPRAFLWRHSAGDLFKDN